MRLLHRCACRTLPWNGSASAACLLAPLVCMCARDYESSPLYHTTWPVDFTSDKVRATAL